MALSPAPNVSQVPYNEEVVWTRAYRRMTGHVVIYDAPNGNPIGEPLDLCISGSDQVWVRLDLHDLEPALCLHRPEYRRPPHRCGKMLQRLGTEMLSIFE